MPACALKVVALVRTSRVVLKNACSLRLWATRVHYGSDLESQRTGRDTMGMGIGIGLGRRSDIRWPLGRNVTFACHLAFRRRGDGCDQIGR